MKQLFDFLHQVEKLKDTTRYNQTSGGRRESSAEHSWRLSLMAMVVARKLDIDIDVDRAMKIAIVHDLAEAVTGDIDAVRIAKGEITRAEKQKMETGAMEKIRTLLADDIGEEIMALWTEYEKNETQESKYVKALDKIETLTQLVEAGHAFYDQPEFIANYADKAVLDFPALVPVLMEVKKQLKDEFEKGGLGWKEEYDSIR